jgi:hypothetical protein
MQQENVVSSRAVAVRNAESALEQLTRDLREAMGSAFDINGNPVNPQAVTVGTDTSTSPPTTVINMQIPAPGTSAPGQVPTQEPLTWSCQGTASNPGYCRRTLTPPSGGSRQQIEIVGFEGIALKDGKGNALTLPTSNPPYLDITINAQVTSQSDPQQYAATLHSCGQNPSSTSCQAANQSNPITVQNGIDLRNFSG